MRVILLSIVLLLITSCGPATITQTNRTERFVVEFSLDSAKVGQRTINLYITDQAGNPIAAEVVVVAPVMLEMGMASPEMTATAGEPGRYQIKGEPFSMLGRWQVDVRITAAGKEDKTTFIVEIT